MTPSRIRADVFNWGHDAHGNPTAHYQLFDMATGRRVYETKRRARNAVTATSCPMSRSAFRSSTPARFGGFWKPRAAGRKARRF